MEFAPEVENAATRTDFQLEEKEDGASAVVPGEESFFDWLERGWIKTKEAAAGVLMLLSRKCGTSFSSAKLNILIEATQMFTFALSPILNEPSAEDTASSFLYYTDVSNLAVWLIGYDFCVYISTTIVLGVLCNVFYVGYAWSRSVFNVLWPIKLLRVTTSILLGVAFIPTIQIFSGLLTCSAAVQAQVACQMFQPVVFFLSSFYILLAVAVGSTYFDPLLNSESPQASAHTRVTVFHFFCKIVLASIHSIWDLEGIDDGHPLELFRHVILTSMSIAIYYLYVWYQPFYAQSINQYHSVCNGVLAWLSTCMFIRYIHIRTRDVNEVFEVAHHDITATLVLGVVLVVPFTLFLIDHRAASVAEKNLWELKNAYEFELKIRRFLLTHHPWFAKVKVNDRSAVAIAPRRLLRANSLQSSNGKFARQDECDGFFGNDQVNELDQDVDETWQERECSRVLKYVRRQFDAARDSFGNSAQICMFEIYFFRCFYEKDRGTVLSRNAVLRAQSRKPFFDIEFGLVKLRSELKHKVSTGKEVISFVTCEKYEREARAFDKMACWQLLEFWKEFQSVTPNMYRIQTLSKAVAESSSKAQSAYARVTKMQPRAVHLHKLYGSFLMDVLNDRLGGAQVMGRSDGNEGKSFNQKRMSDLAEPPSIEAGRADPVIIFEIGEGKSVRFGEITYANEAAGLLLGYESHKVIGHSVQEYLLPPFSSSMREIVQFFYSEGYNPLFSQAIPAFVLTSFQTCTQVNLRFSPYTSNGVDYTMFLSISPKEWGPKWVHKAMRRLHYHGESLTKVLEDNEISSVISQTDLEDEAGNLTGYILCHSHGSVSRVFTGSDGAINLLRRNTTLLDHSSSIGSLRASLNDFIPGAANRRRELLESSEGVQLQLGSTRPELPARSLGRFLVRIEQFEYQGFVLDKVIIVNILPPEFHAVSFRTAAAQSDRSLNLAEGDEHLPNLDSPADASMRIPAMEYVTSVTSGLKTAAQRPASVASHESDGTSATGSSSASAAASYLRKRLQMEGNGNRSSPILRRLKFSYMSTLLIVVGVAVVYYLNQEKAIEQFSSEVTFLNKAGFRRYNAVSISFCVHLLVLANMGVPLPTGVTEQNLRDQLVSNANSLRTIEKSVFEQKTIVDKINEMYTQPGTPLFFLDTTQHHFEVSKTLYTSTSSVAGTALQFAEEPLSSFTLSNPQVYMMITQVFGSHSYLQDLNFTTFLLQAHAEETLMGMVPIFYGSVSFAVVLQVSLLFFLVWPLVGTMERNKVEVLQILQSMPTEYVLEIADRCKKRLFTVHEIAPEVIDAHWGGHSQAIRPGMRSAKKGVVKSGFGSSFRRDSFKGFTARLRKSNSRLARLVRFLCCFSCRGADVSPHPSVHADGSTSEQHSSAEEDLSATPINLYAQGMIVIRMSLPLLTAMAFYALSYSLGYFIQLDYLLRVPTSVNYSGLRRATMRHLMHMVFLFLAQTSFPHEPHYQVSKGNVSEAIAMFEHVNRVLFEGTDTYQGLLFSTREDLDQISLLLEDGCFNWEQGGSSKSAEECQTFERGILSHGLKPAVFELISRLKQVVKEVDTVRSSASPDFDFGEFWRSEEISWLLELESKYLQNQFVTSVKLYVRDATSRFTTDSTTRNVLLALFIFTTISLYVLVVRRIIRTLDNELRRIRRLLLMVPEELYLRHGKLKRFLKKEFSKM
mmetsp:Transcript_20296/g.64807  ORF Transcript_20296/g.64807 Transcript_20296/m.64807 type:complete len:1683 (+) Transcript_20296:407-5455(+)